MIKLRVKDFCKSIATSGKQYAPELMMAGGIALGWLGVYIFWKQSRKAEKRIAYEENKLNADENGVVPDIPESQKKHLSKKDKFIIYLQYCYISMLIGLGSTGLCILSNKTQATRILEMAMLTKLMTDKDAEKKEYVKKLEEEAGEKRVKQIRHEMRSEACSDETETIVNTLRQMANDGDDRTLFIDVFTGQIFPAKVLDVTNAIAEVNERLRLDRNSALKNRSGDAFYASGDLPWGLNEDAFGDVYSALDLGTFLCRLGETNKSIGCRIGELMEFRYYGGSDPLKQSDILKSIKDDDVLKSADILDYTTEFREYFDEDEHIPEVCYIDYTDSLSPTSEIIERCTI